MVSSRRESFRVKAAMAVLVLVSLLILGALCAWIPGEPTRRSTFERWGFMSSPGGGFSIGTLSLDYVRPSYSAKVAADGAPGWPPEWDINLESEARRTLLLDCGFHVDEVEPRLTFFDHGQIYNVELGDSPLAMLPEELQCTHFYGMARPHRDSLKTSNRSKSVGEAGRVVILSTATSVSFLESKHRVLLNRQAFAACHGYVHKLSLVSASSLHGRSVMFAKQYALGLHLAGSPHVPFDTICAVDLDAFFGTFDLPLSYYTKSWPSHKELMFGDTGQDWLNCGFVCARPTAWSASFVQRVLNGAWRVAEGSGWRVGFRREQPAVWHALAQEWREAGLIPYQGHECSHWNACNPATNSLTCWHRCFWSPLLQSVKGWDGIASINSLPHVHLALDDGIAPPLHRMCLKSCASFFSSAVASACNALTNGAVACWPKESSHKTMCDARGCLEQMSNANGGAWLKHTGSKHWMGLMASCIPVNAAEASRGVVLTGRNLGRSCGVV